MRDEIAPHVQDITRALGGKVSELEIEKELSNYVNVYRVSLDTAKRSIVKEHGGQVQVTLGVRSVVTREAADALPPAPAGTGGPSPAAARATPVKIVELREGSSNIAFTARVLGVERREVDVDGGKKAVFSGVIADETAKSQFSAWKDFELRDGDVLRVEGAYVKSWRGIPQVSFDERALVKKLDDGALPPMDELGRSPRMWIEDLSERCGGVDVTVRGILIDLKEGAGLVYPCPECKRVLRKGVCRIHGAVTGTPDLRGEAGLD